MKAINIEVFTHHRKGDMKVHPVLIGSCPWCCRLHKFSVSLKSRSEALSLTGRVMTPEPHRLRCEAFSDGVSLVVRDEPMSEFRRSLTAETPDDWNRWIRVTFKTDEPPF